MTELIAAFSGEVGWRYVQYGLAAGLPFLCQAIGSPGIGNEDAGGEFRIGVQFQTELNDMVVLQLMAGFSRTDDKAAMLPEAPKPAEAAAPVKVFVVGETEGTAAQVYAGEVHSVYESNLSFQTAGKILSRRVKAGDRVRKGQVLAVLDTRDLEQAVYNTQAQASAVNSQLKLAEKNMNDYFDIDLYYGLLKVSVKSSYFRVKERPSFVVYGKKGVFVKQGKDKQEADLKKFYLPEGHGVAELWPCRWGYGTF